MKRVLSLFSGIGAFEKALENIGVEYELVGFSEIDKYAVKSYCAIHGVDERLNLGDITKINLDKVKELGEIDLICHGSPCTSFSMAGKQAGGDEGSGTASSLMWYSVNIIKKVNPKYVIWENVKNVLSSKHIHNFNRYLDTLAESEIGYNNYYQVLNAKDYGVPQNRERIFVVSIRKDIDKGGFAFPEKEELKLRLRDILEPKEAVDEKYYLKDEIVNKIGEFTQEKEPKCVQVGTLDIKGIDQIKRVYSPEGLCPTITTMTGGNRQPKVEVSGTAGVAQKDSLISIKYNKFIEENGYIPEMFNPYNTSEIKDIAPTQTTVCGSTTTSATILIKSDTGKGSAYLRDYGSKGKLQEIDGVCSTLLSAMGSGGGNVPILQEKPRIRKLTVKECWRLMSFSDEDYEKAKNAGISASQLYKQAGNSIVVKVLEKIFTKLLK